MPLNSKKIKVNINDDFWRKRIAGSKYIGRFVHVILKYLPIIFAEFLIDLFRHSNFFWGYGIRWGSYKRICKYLDNTATIMPSVYIYFANKLSIGEKVVLHEFSYISCGDAEIIIGDNVAIATSCVLVTNNHNYIEYCAKTKKRLPGNAFRQITISNNVWIGSQTTVLGGSIIGEGAVIAAGSVVNQNIPPFTIYGGVPAKKLRDINPVFIKT
jgi:acetyltransferase-like isoleucine patch superfamily enzyme